MPKVLSHPVVSRFLIAPCGMNCALCMAHQRKDHHCVGCNGSDADKSQSCVQCIVKNCEELKATGRKFCFSSCEYFPCKRLQQLDKRYRTKYGMSMIANLHFIEEYGINAFLKKERKRWKCSHCGNLVSVHRPVCLFCGAKKEAIVMP